MLSGGGFIAGSQALVPFSVEGRSSTLLSVAGPNTGSTSETLFGEAVCLVGSGATVNVLVGTIQPVSGMGTTTASVSCNSSKVALGGGWTAAGASPATATRSQRAPSGNGWRASLQELVGYSTGLEMDVICAKFHLWSSLLIRSSAKFS